MTLKSVKSIRSW